MGFNSVFEGLTTNKHSTDSVVPEREGQSYITTNIPNYVAYITSSHDTTSATTLVTCSS